MYDVDQDKFLELLGCDFERAGSLAKIICPFHDDTHPSLVIYPTIEEAAHCYTCGETYSWPWVLAKVRDIHFSKACEMLEMPDGQYGDVEMRGRLKIDMNFCEQPVYVDQFTAKHELCLKNYPISVTKWLEKKGLTDVAKKLDWRWHDGTVFKKWGKGIVIPYKVDGKVVWERFRAEALEGNFVKPLGPVDVGIQPYYDTFRKNDTVYLVEGESDAASIYSHFGSAIGIPGAKAKKAINTVACFIADKDYIKTVVLCGDADHSGQDMNRLYREALHKFVDRPLEIIEYEHKTDDKKADVNDDHARGSLRLPPQHWSIYGDNHTRNYGIFGSQTACKTLEGVKVISNKERTKQWLKNKFTN